MAYLFIRRYISAFEAQEVCALPSDRLASGSVAVCISRSEGPRVSCLHASVSCVPRLCG